jgi:cytochrome c2
MKKVFKIVGLLLLLLIIGIIGLLFYIKLALPKIAKAENMTIVSSPERIERGRYLANHVAVCMDCHSTRDWTKFSGPITPGTLGKGGELFNQQYGFPGKYISKNITPASLKKYSDGELYRVITTGVNKDGKAMFPVMPYPYYGKMDPEDIKSIIAYLRSLPAIENEVEESVSDFPMSLIINTIPCEATPKQIPSPSNAIAYGAYLVNAAGCMECHTQVKNGQIIPELQLSGGREFTLAQGEILRSSNITPDDETGIGLWTQEAFVQKFKAYLMDSGYVPTPVVQGEYMTIMPWTMYAGMSQQDLEAIYSYLHSIPAKKNNVTKFTPAKL